MKKLLILSTLLLALLTSCSKAPINGKLDGQWQLTQIDFSNGETVNKKPERIYFSVQLHLLSLRQTNGGEYLGRFNHTGDSLHINMLEGNKEEMKVFGMDDTVQHFGVEKLSHSKMILKSEYGRLFFRKF
ncbi:MAG: lipocalin-like domain-containing protein [Bacteroides sp.]